MWARRHHNNRHGLQFSVGFDAGIYLDGALVVSGNYPDTSGNFTNSFTGPTSGFGAHTVEVRNSVRDDASVTFTVDCATTGLLPINTGSGGTSAIGAVDLFAGANSTCSPQPSCSGNFQFLAAQFTLSHAATLDSVQLWVGPFSSGGSVAVKIRVNNTSQPFKGLPGASLYSKTYAVGGIIGAQWVPFSNYGAASPRGPTGFALSLSLAQG